jgi:hypothetical protein
MTVMSAESRELGRALRKVQDKIHACPPGAARDELERRFNRVIARLKAMTARVMLQWPFADDDDLQMVRDTELLWALSAWEDET